MSKNVRIDRFRIGYVDKKAAYSEPVDLPNTHSIERWVSHNEKIYDSVNNMIGAGFSANQAWTFVGRMTGGFKDG